MQCFISCYYSSRWNVFLFVFRLRRSGVVRWNPESVQVLCSRQDTFTLSNFLTKEHLFVRANYRRSLIKMLWRGGGGGRGEGASIPWESGNTTQSQIIPVMLRTWGLGEGGGVLTSLFPYLSLPVPPFPCLFTSSCAISIETCYIMLQNCFPVIFSRFAVPWT